METVRIVSQEDRGDGNESQINVFKKEENARECFNLLCKEAYDNYAEDYQIERRENYMYVDDLYIYIEISECYFDDEARESGNLYSYLKKKGNE